MITVILGIIDFCMLAILVAGFEHPFVFIALMILLVWVYKECKKHD